MVECRYRGDFCIENEERKSQSEVIVALRSDELQLIILVASATRNNIALFIFPSLEHRAVFPID